MIETLNSNGDVNDASIQKHFDHEHQIWQEAKEKEKGFIK
jgi:hypothetical protein